jgi:6-phosphogluconolactonase
MERVRRLQAPARRRAPPARRIEIFPDAGALARAAAAAFAALAREAVAARDRFIVALAGGTTPRALYQQLAAAHREDCPWPRVHVFLGDERFVPPGDPASNDRMVRETLLDPAGVPDAQRHPFPVERGDPEAVARAHDAALRAFFGPSGPAFDLVLLGLGADGHTASLFPRSPALRLRARWVAAVEAPVPPRARLTLTLPAINAAARVWFLVTGEAKAEALRQTLHGPRRPLLWPAQAVHPVRGEVVWWVDRAAAELLPRT